MIRVDLKDQEANTSWGYMNQDKCVEYVSMHGDELVEIVVDNYEAVTVYKEDLDYLIKALQEAKKFIDSNK